MACALTKFHLTKPTNLDCISSDTSIHFVKINGEPTHEDDFGIPSTWTPRSCDTVQALSAAVAGLITKHLAIPLSACRCFGASHMIMLP